MSGKQHKREIKRQKELARQAIRQAERRRTLVTLAIICGVVVLGGALVFVTLKQEGDALARQQRELEELQSEAAIRASEEARQRADREVACGADRPANADGDRPTFERVRQVTEDGVDYGATIQTSCGTVTLDLAEGRAPETVNGFIFLARQGFYDGLEIFRNATSIGALQTGSGTNEAAFQIGYTLPDELGYAEDAGYPPGSVAMAKSQQPDSAGSQFFFVYNDKFDEAFAEQRVYSRFATVTQGLDVLERIGKIERTGGEQSETPAKLVYLEEVTITADGRPLAGEAEPAPTETPTK